jgi:hypothetical protein
MQYIEAPAEYKGKGKSLFLGGGISNCPDWQKEFAALLKNERLVLLNPRRKEFGKQFQKIMKEQISWEYKHLRKADALIFWFPKETLCPITLYELGAHAMTSKTLFVGMHPKYKRRKDVEIQLKLVRPKIKIVYALKELARQVHAWVKK